MNKCEGKNKELQKQQQIIEIDLVKERKVNNELRESLQDCENKNSQFMLTFRQFDNKLSNLSKQNNELMAENNELKQNINKYIENESVLMNEKKDLIEQKNHFQSYSKILNAQLQILENNQIEQNNKIKQLNKQNIKYEEEYAAVYFYGCYPAHSIPYTVFLLV
eukprot:12011_1